MTTVTLLRDRFVVGWPSRDGREPGPAYLHELGAALERDYSTDAHFAAYRSPNRHRLVREAIDELGTIELTAIVFDVDGPGHEALEPWRRQLRERVLDLAAAHPEPYFYETRGGARIVYRQAEPTVLRTQDDAQRWRQVYAVAVAYLARRFGIAADPSCADWQRLYRLPRATRDAGGRPENWPTWGDATSIGTLEIEATHADVDCARRASKAFEQTRRLDFRPSGAAGDGLLFHLLRARGYIVREHPSGYVIRCPFEREHTTGRTGDSSTLLYAPANGEEIGAICCLHGHCAGRSLRDWLRAFEEREIGDARRAAGIVRAA